MRAVYASLEEETALREVTSRKSALGGRSGISVGEYPRITYVLSVATQRNPDLAAKLPSELADVVRLCLHGSGYYASQELAGICISEGIDSVVFPSATGLAETLQCIWQTPALMVSWSIVPKFWRPFADHGWGTWPVEFRFRVWLGAPGLTFCSENQKVAHPQAHSWCRYHADAKSNTFIVGSPRLQTNDQPKQDIAVESVGAIMQEDERRSVTGWQSNDSR